MSKPSKQKRIKREKSKKSVLISSENSKTQSKKVYVNF